MAFLIVFAVFFMVIALTIILGGIGRGRDRLVDEEGRASRDQRLPTDREAHGY
jgi:hypothetical protein